jgi:hypothetical protein
MILLFIIILIIIYCLFYESFENNYIFYNENKEFIKPDDNIVNQVYNFIDEKDIVLEIGSDSVRSIIINSLLKNSSNHLVIEPNPRLLEINRNDLSFIVTSKPISNYNKLKEIYKLDFNVIVINCRSCFCELIKVFNTNIRFFDKIFITKPNKCDLDKLKETGYLLVDRYDDNYVFIK